MPQEIAHKPLISRYPSGSLRELLYFSLPLILSLFSASFMGFCDRIFLAHYSLGAMEGCVSASYLCSLFQLPIIRVVAMAQVFVGLYCGSRQFERIGPVIWQMIWLSIFSMIFTLPVGHFVSPYFFGGTSVEGYANQYFQVMMFANFLFPLGTTLSSFFIGQGRTRVIFLTTLLSHGMNIALDYIFIFGLPGVLAPMGIFGAAFATILSQFTYCAILLGIFLSQENKKLFKTDDFAFKWDNFWNQLRVGLPRGIARIIILTAWVAISRLMTLKGGDYLMVLSIGGSLILLFTFILDGAIQGMVTVASNLMGAKDYPKIWKLFRSSLLLVGSVTAILSIPFIFFPDFTLHFFFTEMPSVETYATLKNACFWLWFFFFCYGINFVGQSLITASRDLTFYMCSILFVWATSYLPVYLAMEKFHFSPDKLWLIMGLDNLIFGLFFILRASKEKWKEREKDFELPPLEVEGDL